MGETTFRRPSKTTFYCRVTTFNVACYKLNYDASAFL